MIVVPNNIIAGRGSAPSVQGKGDFPHRLVYQTLYVETVAWKWSVVMHEAAGQFAKAGFSARSHIRNLEYSRDLFVWWSEMSNVGERLSW